MFDKIWCDNKKYLAWHAIENLIRVDGKIC